MFVWSGMTTNRTLTLVRPVLLDLFCGAGGAAMGYMRAGFKVIGIDRNPQPHYPFEFRRGNALCPPIGLGNVSVIHASPPCQAYSQANFIHGNAHPELIEATRALLVSTGLPYVIENVPNAPLIDPVTVCGRTLGLAVKRHRLFESNVPLVAPPCPFGHPGDWVSVFGKDVLSRGRNVGPRTVRAHLSVNVGRRAMGIDWMTMEELSEAIPPAYTEMIGAQVLAAMR
jgi:DNA (cytosine-5)-methyltransferase 1